MKKFIVLMVISILCAFSTNIEARQEVYVVELIPATATYEERVEDGVTVWQRSEVFHKGDSMGFSGTSTCQVIDLSKMDIEGYFTFQFKMLAGTTDVPLSGTTVGFGWKGSNIDSEEAWNKAIKNIIFSNVNAATGITNVGYDINDITGVTPFKYMRPEFESGISNQLLGLGNLRPVGLLYIR